MSYQRTKDFDRLSFLYMLTGDTEKLRKMLKIASMRQDTMGRYHNALLLGNAEEKVKVLEQSGNLNLAYISAKIHGLEEDAERIKVTIETNGGSVEGLLDKLPKTSAKSGGRLLQPPTPIVRENNWPTLEVKKTTLEDLEAAESAYDDHADPSEANHEPQESANVSAWDDGGDDDMDDDLGFDDDDGLGWGDDDGLDDLGDEFDTPEEEAKDDMDDLQDLNDDSLFQMPPAGRPPAGCWMANSSHAADHLAAGGSSSALQLLNRQIAASNFAVMKKSIINSYIACSASLPGVPGSVSLTIPLLRNDNDSHPGKDSLPRVPLSLKNLVTGVKLGYKAFQSGKFNDSKAAFNSVLLQIPLVVTNNRNEANEVKEMLEICREYITAIRIKGAMAEAVKNPARSTELSAYFTHCNLQPIHLLLALRSAMGTSFKHKNYIVAASFARRLLELPDMSSERNADLRVKATKVLQKSEQMARNEHTLNYDESSAFVLDCKDLVPITSSDTSVECSYCGSRYLDESMKGKICSTCNLCVVGVNTIGLVTGS